MSTEEPLFACDYIFEGDRWSLDFRAKDADEAQKRIEAVKLTIRLCGEITDIIPVEDIP